jgi:prephenate dehydrogenase
MKTAGIVGLGLMGGSLARDLAAAGWRVLAADRDPAAERAATDAGVVDGPLDAAAVDALVLAVPVRSAEACLQALAPTLRPDAVVTDLGSTKRSVLRAAAGLGLAPRFVGAHPLAGHHQSGWSASRTGLFRGAPVFICPGGATPEAVERTESLWRSVGAVPRRIPAAEHDHRLARVSQLPQVAATALAATLSRDGIAPPDLGPGGRDATRLAASDPTVWTDILLDCADEVGPAIDGLVRELERIRDAIGRADAAAVAGALDEGRRWILGGSATS